MLQHVRGQRREVSLAGRQSPWSPQQHRAPLPGGPGQGSRSQKTDAKLSREGGRLPSTSANARGEGGPAHPHTQVLVALLSDGGLGEPGSKEAEGSPPWLLHLETPALGLLPCPPRLCPLGLFLGAVSDFPREPPPPTQGPPQKAASACLLSDLTRDPGSGSQSPRQDSRSWVGVGTSGSSMHPGLWSREARMGTHKGASEWEEKKPESRGRPGRRKQEPRQMHGGPPS